MDRPGRPHRRSLNEPVDLAHPLVVELLARSAFPPAGTPVACACSGGPDSLALVALAVAAGCQVEAVHVDHGLRPGSDAEAAVAADAASRLGAGFRSHRVEVPDGPNLEARARAARYGVLPAGVLTGHTADDRAETVLLHLLRGAGPAGAVGIARGPQRPLLDLRRHETTALCDALGLVVVRDPSNDDPRFRRNRVRHELLPLIADIGDRDPVPVLVRQADLFADVAAALGAAAALLDPTVAADLAGAPVAVAGAAVRAWLVAEGVGEGYGVDAAAVGRVLDVARGAVVATEIVGGWRVARSHGRLSVSRSEPWQDAAHE
ncbi:MAG: tilS [Ilumatobacteraceae bacterium]|nr:tilS [Ilumatobacteraceae bacterium]